MTATPKTLVPAQYVPNVTSALYTATGVDAAIGAVVVSNSAGVDATVTLHIVPSGDASSGANKLADAHRVRPNEAWRAVPIEGQHLNDGDAIYAFASASDTLTIRVSGVEIS